MKETFKTKARAKPSNTNTHVDALRRAALERARVTNQRGRVLAALEQGKK